VHFRLAKEETSCVLSFVNALQLRKKKEREKERVGVSPSDEISLVGKV